MSDEQVSPIGADLREPGPSHWIATERLDPGPPPGWWRVAALGLGLIVAMGLLALAGEPEQRLRAETAYQESDGFLQGIHALVGVTGARAISALCAGAVVASTAWIARRLFHLDAPALLAAGLVAIDPGLLTQARLATPVLPALAASTAALAWFLSRRPRDHWWGSGFLAFAAFLDPYQLFWALPAAALILLRGHIYAAPQHALVAGSQAIAIPLVGGLIGLAGSQSLVDGCYEVRGLPGLLRLESVDLGGFVATPNPITWFGGLVALLFLLIWALSQVLGNFRVQRLPGRVQLRLPEGLKRIHGRVLWLAAFALVAPSPFSWLPLFAIALAAGIDELGRDARAFGTVVGLVLLAFAIVASWQGIGALGLDLQGPTLPWTRSVSC